jgi:O-antigen/teichoic acid export membrane protein
VVNHTFGSAIRWNAIGAISRVSITIGCQVALLRILGPDVAGKFAIFLVVVGIGNILAEGGMMVAIIRRPDIDDRFIGNAIFLIFTYALVITLVLMSFNPIFVRLFKLARSDWYIPIVAAMNVMPMALSSIPLSLLRRQYRSRDLQMVQIGGYTLGFGIIALPLTFVLHSAAVMIIAFSVQTFVILIAAVIVSRCPIRPSIRGAGELVHVSSRALSVNIVYFLNESIGNVLTAHFMGTRATGLFGTAFNLMRMPTDVIITTLHAPLIVSTARDGEQQETRDRFLSTLNVLAVLIFSGLLLVSLCGEHFIPILLGTKWIEAGPVLSVMALVMIARLLSMISGALIWGHGRLMLDLIAQVCALFMVVGSFLLVRPTTVEEMAWLIFASVSLRMIIQCVAAMRYSKISHMMMFRALVAPTLVSLLFMLPTFWLAKTYPPERGLGQFAIFSVVVAVLLITRTLVAIWNSPYSWAVSIARAIPRLGLAMRTT